MKKHGASHGAAVLVCTITSALLVDALKKHVPAIYNSTDKLSKFLLDLFNWNIASVYLTILIYAVILAIIWGIAFSFVHKDKPSRNRK